MSRTLEAWINERFVGTLHGHLVGNTDAHLKNLSFLVSHDGIGLAPFYDLLSTAVYETRAFDRDRWPLGCTLAWPIGQTARVPEIDRSALVEAGRRMGIKPATANAMVDRLRNAVTREWALSTRRPNGPISSLAVSSLRSSQRLPGSYAVCVQLPK
jgi:hypothetical protein